MARPKECVISGKPSLFGDVLINTVQFELVLCQLVTPDQ